MKDPVSIYEYVRNGVEAQAKAQNLSADWKSRYYYPLIDAAKYRELNKKNAYFILFWLLLADRQYMSAIIQYQGNNMEEKLTRIFSDDPYEAYFRYSYIQKMDKEEKNKTVLQLCSDNGIAVPDKDFSKNKLIGYMMGIIECAEYLSTDKINGDEVPSIERFLEKPSDENGFKEYLWEMRKLNRISEVGTAVACNWLKECGADWLGKPDMHVMRIAEKIWDQSQFENARSIPGHGRSKFYPPETAMFFLFKWGKEVDATPFLLDRLIYLYCTGCYFYAEVPPTSEKELLDYIDSD